MMHEVEVAEGISIFCTDFERFLASKINGGLLSWYMVCSYSHGHMAVRYENKQIFPSVASVFLNEGASYLTEEQIQYIERQIMHQIDAGEHLFLKKDRFLYAIPRLYMIEKQIFDHIVRISSVKCDPIEINVPDSLQDEQKAAVIGALSHSFSCITGGPGTGKTYTAGVFLKLLASRVSYPLHIALLAPTGRAATRLLDSIKSHIVPSPSIHVTAMTVHKALKTAAAYLPYTTILVDEASMLDSQTMAHLLEKISTGTSVVLLGDKDQLPSIEPGQPFFDIIEHGASIFPIFRLKKCLRTSVVSLHRLAKAAAEYDGDAFFSIAKETNHEITFVELEGQDLKSIFQKLCQDVLSKWEDISSVEEARELLTKTVILTPVRRSIFGTEMINAYGCSQKKKFMPIVATKNQYEVSIMNGDLGVLDVCEKVIHFPQISIPDVLYPYFEPAFAMTIHKSQGSEFDTVYTLFSKETFCSAHLLYTALTRAKRQVYLFCYETAVHQFLQRKTARVTSLAQFFS